MRRSYFALRALATLTFSTVSALPQYDQTLLKDETFTCPDEQPLSMCCNGQIASDGTVEDCEESWHFMVGPKRLSANDFSRRLHSASINQCDSQQIKNGYKRAVCCKSGFYPVISLSGFNGLNCISGTVEPGSKWKVEPRGEAKSRSHKRELEWKSPPTESNPTTGEVDIFPVVADDEGWIFALSPEPEFPEDLEGPSMLSMTPSELSSLLSERNLPAPSTDAEPCGNEHFTRDAVPEDLLSELALPLARRNQSKRSVLNEEPSGNGHGTQDAVLKDLLTSAHLAHRSSASRKRGRRRSAARIGTSS